jgi:hypothetical protein
MSRAPLNHLLARMMVGMFVIEDRPMNRPNRATPQAST